MKRLLLILFLGTLAMSLQAQPSFRPAGVSSTTFNSQVKTLSNQVAGKSGADSVATVLKAMPLATNLGATYQIMYCADSLYHGMLVMKDTARVNYDSVFVRRANLGTQQPVGVVYNACDTCLVIGAVKIVVSGVAQALIDPVDSTTALGAMPWAYSPKSIGRIGFVAIAATPISSEHDREVGHPATIPKIVQNGGNGAAANAMYIPGAPVKNGWRRYYINLLVQFR